MAKKYLVFTLVMGLMLPLSSCTSGGNKEGDTPQQQNDSAFSQEGEGDFAKGDNPQNQLQGDGTPTAQGQAGAAPGDLNAPQDAGQDLALDGQTKPGDAGGAKDELSLEDPQPLPDGVTGEANKPADTAAAPPPDAGGAQAANPAPSDEPLFNGDANKPPEETPAAPGGDVAAAPAPEPAAPKPFAPLLKVKETAFDKDGTNLNRVYLARSSDKSVAAISKKLYGSEDRAKDLKAWNPSIAKRKPKVGDKIYYQSATNPQDQQMMNYYDEAGIQPKVYTTQDGDNLRKLSKAWLGSSDSWKEVWATNPSVDSKGDVPAGLQIKYWDSDAAGAVAKAEPPPVPAPDMAPPPADMAPPPPDMAHNDVPPPPPPPPPAPPTPASTPDMAAGSMAPPPPPPPPGDGAAPPPPPPPLENKAAKKAPGRGGDEATGEDQDTTMAMGLGAILLLAAAVLFVVLRRNRAKRVDLGQTQV